MQKQKVADLNATNESFDAAGGFAQSTAKNGLSGGWHHENHHRVHHCQDGEDCNEEEPEPTGRNFVTFSAESSVFDVLPKEDVNLLVENVER